MEPLLKGRLSTVDLRLDQLLLILPTLFTFKKQATFLSLSRQLLKCFFFFLCDRPFPGK